MHGSVILGNEHISYFITILRFAFSFTEIRNVLRIKVNADSVNPNDPSQMTKLLDKVMNFPNSITFFFHFFIVAIESLWSRSSELHRLKTRSKRMEISLSSGELSRMGKCFRNRNYSIPDKVCKLLLNGLILKMKLEYRISNLYSNSYRYLYLLFPQEPDKE